MNIKKRIMKKEYYNTEAPEAKAKKGAPGVDTREVGTYDRPRADVEAVAVEEVPPTPSALDEVGSLNPADNMVIAALVPKPKQDYAVAGAGMYADIAGHTPALLTEEGKKAFTEYVAKVGNKIEAKNVLFGLNEKGEIYNNLTAYEKAFIVALRVLLSDSTADRHALIEGKRTKEEREKAQREAGNTEGIDFFGAGNIRPEAYARYRYETARNDRERAIYAAYKDYPVNPKEAQLLRKGFSDKDIIVVIDKNTFIRDYLGGTKGGKQTKAFTDALARLQSGRVALTQTSAGARELSTDNLILRTASFFAEKKGQRVEYHVISLHPNFGRVFTPNYITYPANNAEVLGAILGVRNGADGLLSLYDVLLKEAAKNFGKIDRRPGVQSFTLKEADLLPFITTEARLKKNRKEAVARLYSDTGINLFYTVGLLADRVAQPTEEARKEAAATGKDVEVEVHYKRVAATNCTR